MGRAPAKKPGKRDDRFHPAPGSRRLVPMRSGTDVHTPDGKRWHVQDADLAATVVAFHDDDRLPGAYLAQLIELAAERPDRYGPVLATASEYMTDDPAEEVEQ